MQMHGVHVALALICNKFLVWVEYLLVMEGEYPVLSLICNRHGSVEATSA